MNIIVAVDDKGAIGYKNQLIYNIKEDKQYFKSKTIEKIVVMGRKTFESLPFGKALENRINIVFSTQENFSAPDCIVVHSIDEFRKICNENNFSSDDIFIIGGSAIYKLFLPFCDTLYMTEIFPDTKQKCDTFFADIPCKKLKSCSELKEFDGGKYRFAVYDINPVINYT
jgi:dihydrofolate reductase